MYESDASHNGKMSVNMVLLAFCAGNDDRELRSKQCDASTAITPLWENRGGGATELHQGRLELPQTCSNPGHGGQRGRLERHPLGRDD